MKPPNNLKERITSISDISAIPIRSQLAADSFSPLSAFNKWHFNLRPVHVHRSCAASCGNGASTSYVIRLVTKPESQ